MKATLPSSLHDLKPTFSKLREGISPVSLKELLGNEIAQTFASWIINRPANKTLCINLVNTLPKLWHELPLEQCQHDGIPFFNDAQIIRHAPLPKKALAQSLSTTTTLLNTWPTNEHFFADLPRVFTYPLIGRKRIKGGFKRHNLAEQSLLCVIAHGNEHNAEEPLLLECQKQAWALPSSHLPPLVIILACGGEQGNLHDYALKLLQEEPDEPNDEGVITAYGAKTVFIAKSKLDAKQTNAFIKNFLQKWHTGQSANSILYELQQAGDSEHAAMRLHVIGQGQLCQVIAGETDPTQIIAPPSWEALTLNARIDNNALVMLLNRLTHHTLVKYSNIRSVVNALYNALGLNYNDPQEKQHLVYDRLDRVYSVCDDLTKTWLSYFLLYLSSMHNHNKITFYEKEASELENIPMAGREISLFYHAQAQFSDRNYIKIIQLFIKGMTSLSKCKTIGNEAEYKLFEMTTNLFINLAFTDMALYCFKKANKCIKSQAVDSKQYINESFTQLDREARLFARMGDPDNEENGEAGLNDGIYILNKKRQKAINSMGYDGDRELSLLLVFAVWMEAPDHVYIKEALNVLHDIKQVTENIINKTGNNSELYLLKGVANWAWQQHDEQAIKLLAHYQPTIIKLCHRPDQQDSGPLGAIIAYMHLMDKDDKTLQQAWNAIARKMQGQLHYFELTLFYALMNKEKKSAQYYKAFKEQQQSVIDELKQLETTVLDAEFYDLLKATEIQLDKCDPMNVNGSTFSTDVEVMRRSGLVPF